MAGSPSDPIELPEYHPWRRPVVFLIVFFLTASASLGYVFTQPAEYRVTSRLQVIPSQDVADADQGKSAAPAQQSGSALQELQLLTSDAVLWQAIGRVNHAAVTSDPGEDAVRTARQLLQARIVDGTQVIELSAEGPDRVFLELLINAVADTDRDRILMDYNRKVADQSLALADEIKRDHTLVVAAEEKSDAFREANGNASDEGEKLVLADLQNLDRAYTAALGRYAAADARLRSLSNSLDSGGAREDAKPDPNVADMEQRASTLRQQLTDLQLRFTPQYLALDADTRTLPRRITDLDRQIAQRRTAAQQTALQTAILTAEQEFRASEVQLDRLRRDVAERQRHAEEFAARLGEYRMIQDELDQAEQTERETTERLANLQAHQGERAPRMEILQAAFSDNWPIRPDFVRGAWLAVAASFACGVFAAWLTGLFKGSPAVAYRSEPAPTQRWDAAPALAFNAGAPPAVILLPAPDNSGRAVDQS